MKEESLSVIVSYINDVVNQTDAYLDTYLEQNTYRWSIMLIGLPEGRFIDDMEHV